MHQLFARERKMERKKENVTHQSSERHRPGNPWLPAHEPRGNRDGERDVLADDGQTEYGVDGLGACERERTEREGDSERRPDARDGCVRARVDAV
jgi:hypothetical protein